MSYKKGVLRNFAKFTGKHLCQSLFLLKKRLRHRCFPVNFARFLRTPFLTEHLWWLLLYKVITFFPWSSYLFADLQKWCSEFNTRCSCSQHTIKYIFHFNLDFYECYFQGCLSVDTATERYGMGPHNMRWKTLFWWEVLITSLAFIISKSFSVAF